MLGPFICSLLAGLIAAAVAAVELATRYRDDPLDAVRSRPAWVYLIVNFGAGVSALLLLLRYGSAIVGGGTSLDPVKAVLLAGLGALVALRFSVFKLKDDGGKDISIGPALIIERLLDVIDRSVDRKMAERRAGIARALTPSVDFSKHGVALVTQCLTLLQNVSPEEQQRISALQSGLANRRDLTDREKARALILGLLGLIGEDVLRLAVQELSGDVTPPV